MPCSTDAGNSSMRYSKPVRLSPEGNPFFLQLEAKKLYEYGKQKKYGKKIFKCLYSTPRLYATSCVGENSGNYKTCTRFRGTDYCDVNR